MHSFLALPPEIRDQILSYAISSAAPEPGTNRSFQECKDLEYLSRIGGSGVCYSSFSHSTNPSGLLRTNKELHEETKAILKRFKEKEANKYTLNICLVKESILHAEYTSVPPLQRNVDELAVTFHISGPSEAPTESNGFMDKDGSTGQAVWRLYSVLERFLRCGAEEAKSKNEDRKLKLKVLNIDVTTPTQEGSVLAPADISPDRLPAYRKTTSPHNQLVHAEALAKFMYIWIEGLLRMSDPSYALPGTPIAKYGRMFFDRIERIKICVDGVEKWSVDVVEMAGEIQEREE
jgi:hypothetical protein